MGVILFQRVDSLGLWGIKRNAHRPGMLHRAGRAQQKELDVYYTGTTIRMDAASNAVKLAYKLVPGNSAVVIVTTIEGGCFTFAAPVAGSYRYEQYTEDGDVVRYGSFEVKQSLATASSNYDPRSAAEKTLEAIDAKIAGRVLTLEQSHITIGDRSLQYINSIHELEQWRAFYQRLVDAENGIKDCKTEVCRIRNV